MSKVAGFIIGAALIVAGIVTGNPALIIQGSAMVVTQAIVLLTMPKVPARQASEMSIQLGEQPRSMIVGEAFTAGSLVDGFNYGGKYNTDWECLIIRLADHKCHSLTGFYVNDEYVPYTGNGNYPQFDNNHFELYFRADTSTELLPDVVLDEAPGWTANDVGESGCDVVVCYRADKPDAKKPAWPGGRPRFGFVVKGALCYDPRLDDTVTGGAGDHRFDDPDTWEWSENAAICRYKWVRGVYANDDVTDQTKLLVGRGLTAEEAPPENIIAAANLCDEIAAAGYPYEIRDNAGSGVDGHFSPDGSIMYQEDATSLFVWDVATLTLINTRTGGPFSYIAPAEGALYTLGGDGLWRFDEDGTGETWLTPSGSLGILTAGMRYVGDELLFYPVTSNEEYYGRWNGVDVDPTDIGFSATHFFEGPDSSQWAVGFDVITQDDLHIRRLSPDDPEIYAELSTAGGSAYAMWNGDGGILVCQAGAITLYDADDPSIVLAGPTAITAGGGFVFAAFNAVLPGAATMWIGFSEIDTRNCTVLRTVDPDDWVAQLALSSGAYDRVTHAIITHVSGTDEITRRFLDRHGAYRVAGPIYANQEHIEVEEMFAAATAGSVVTREGSVELEPGHAKSVVATFSDADLLSGSEVTWNQGFLSEANAEWVNTVVARYVEPSQKWNDHAAPVVRSTADIIADGRPREASITLRLVRYQMQALRVAEINRRLGRLWGRATVKLGPRFCELEDGDWVQWTSDRYFSGATKTFRIEAYSIDEKWQNALTLREINGSVFADDATFDPDLSVPGKSPVPPDIGEPEADNWALTAITLDSAGASIPALHIEGDASDDDYVEQIIFEYWLDDGVTDPTTDPDDVPWITAGTRPPTTTQIDITTVTGGETYYAAVSYVVDGETGDRLVLGPVTLTDFDETPFLELEDDATPLHLENGSTLLHLG